MLLLNHIKNNDINGLKMHLSYLFDSCSYHIRHSSLDFDSAEELFHFFILDILTSLTYAFSKDTDLMSKVIENMKSTVLSMESNLSKQCTQLGH